MSITIILFLVEFVRGAYLIAFLPTYSVDELGLPISIAGTAITAHYLTDTVFKIWIGYLLDRFSARTIVFAGLLLSAIGLFATQYAHLAWILILSSALFGIGASPIWIVCLSQVRQNERATRMGMLYTLWLIGLGAGPVAINFLIDYSYSLSLFVLIGLWLIAWLISFRLSDERISTGDTPSFGQQLKRLWDRLKKLKPLLPGMVLQTAAAGMLVPVMPTFTTKVLGFSHATYSYTMIAGGVFAVAGLIPMGKLSDRFNKKWFLVLGFGLLAFSLYALLFVSQLNQALFLAAVMGLSYSAVLPAWNALLSYHVPDDQQGVGWGIFSSVEGIGVMFGPVIGGWIADWLYESATIAISAVLLLGISIFYLLYPFQRLLPPKP
ncbi:MFS transporter [Effusibacillus dendaii]|uniref:MFS transporter n=1 Tax=Effusibacillus dendaii TaxID=2743772 RepID=A0A7I8DGT1_9BACL|nr:MFS transporter [Effusibacillus dendaii]BCJ87780.1 MFS transporter [Effusibacillus dendaii]